MATNKTRADLVNQVTRFQVIMRGPNGSKLHLGFSARKTKSALFSYLLANGNEAADLAKMTATDEFVWLTKNKAWFCNGVTVEFSGATERDLANPPSGLWDVRRTR